MQSCVCLFHSNFPVSILTLAIHEMKPNVGRNNPRKDYKIGSVLLEKVSEERDLGVHFSDNLKPSLQCVEAAKKASSALGINKRTFLTFEISSFALLYKTYVRCHMEYCVQAWNPYYRKDG